MRNYILLVLFTLPLLCFSQTINCDSLNRISDTVNFVDTLKFNNKLFEGKCITYFKNGKINHKQKYKKGILNGVVKSYHENGKLAIRSRYRKTYLLNHKRWNSKGDKILFQKFIRGEILKDIEWNNRIKTIHNHSN